MTVAGVKTHQRQKNYGSDQIRRFPEIPELENGDHLTREEFERRYDAMPHLKKAELIEGRVYIPSPVRRSHSKAHAEIVGWLIQYCAATDGVEVNDNLTVRLDKENQPQPDALLRITSESEGTSKITKDDYLEGPPELIVEIAGSSVAFDLYEKQLTYQRHRVREYLVWQIYENRLDWFELQEGKFVARQPDADGIIRSRVFPGLYLAVEALLTGNLAEVLAVLQKGLQTEEHTAFVEYLQKANNV
jgi:Uma2 family endonuclease